MNFCSDCGQPVELRSPSGDSHRRYVCVQCGAVHYMNPRVLLSCIAYQGDRVLAGRRAQAPDAGKWGIPSGFLEQHESLEQAAVRETFEETGVKINPARLELYSIFSLPAISQVYVVFRTELEETPQLRAGPECQEVRLIQMQEIERQDLAFVITDIDSPKILFQELKSQSFSIHKWCIDTHGVRPKETRAYRLNLAR